ncbi:hypothetical protein TNCV_733561 [Trichonephila clavipes]|nr:hypothetical protein TNCV_733561 [Trichonephila clavipes]
MIDTGWLPYEISFVVDKSCVITANIDVADGLANEAFGKLSHFEFDDQNRVLQEGGSKQLGKQYHVLPLIPSGDFDKDEGLRLVKFLKLELNLGFVYGKAGGWLGMVQPLMRCFHDS